ncbi:methanol dehydrogenase, partial [Enterocloster bolteae]
GWVIIILWGVDEGWGGMGWAAWPGARELGGGIRYGRERTGGQGAWGRN